MKEEFEYGELVEVRDYNSEEWFQRYYVATVEFPDTGKKWYCTHSKGAKANDHHAGFDCWHKIRKIQKPEHDLIDIEQPETKPLFISTQGVFTAEEAVTQLQERIEKLEAIVNGAIKHINEQFDSIKKQLK